jgi:hypothetical protein
MLEFFIDNIFVVASGHVFQQSVGIPKGTVLCPSVAVAFNLTFQYIEDV